MFCGNCGAQNPDGARNCSNCGAPLAPAQPQPYQPQPQAKKPGQSFDLKSLTQDKNKLIGLCAIAAVVVIVLILIIALASGRSEKSLMNKYVDAVFDCDAKAIINLMPDFVVDAYAEEEDISKSKAKKELIENLEDDLEDYEDDFKEVSGAKASIEDEDEMKSRDIRDMTEELEDEYDLKVKIKAAKTLEVEVSGKYDGDKFKFDMENIVVVKIGGSWYILSPYIGTMYYGLMDEVG